MAYALTLHSYCGMAVPIEEGDRSEVRIAAAQQIRMTRAEHRHVTIITRGQEWELTEPEDCAMVPDDAGILSLQNVGAECRECGQQIDDTDRRRMSASALRYFTCAECNNPEPFDDDDDQLSW